MLNRRRQTYIRKHKPKIGPRTLLTGFATVLCLFVALQLNAHPLLAPSALPETALAADSTFYGHYPFIRFIDAQEDATLVRLSDKDFLDKAGKVVFKVNSYDTYTNDTLLQLLEKEIIPRINKDSLRLRRIIVRGASSPDGPVPGNRMLSRRRSEALTLFLRAHLSVPVDEENLSTEVVTEDYGLLLVMMERAGDPAAGIVRSLCEKHVPRYEYTILKNKLKLLQGGILWRHLLKDYFPELRAARVVLVFDKPEVKEVQEVQEVQEVPVVPAEPEDSSELSTVNSQLSTDKVPRRELMSVKTNLLLYGFYLPGGYNRWCPIPNVALEFYPKHGHFTYGASIDFPWWRSYNDFKFFEVRNYQVEARYYFRSGDIKRRKPGEGAAFRGWYLQGYAHVGLFNICFDKDSGYEGEFFGAGLGAGYVLPISRKGHWKLEFSLQAGFVYGKHDPYQFENLINPNYHDKLYYYRWTGKSEDFKLRQYRFSWIGPTRVGVTLTYDLLYLRGKKKGVSFRPWEKIEN
jgi:hypothetical protein